jgi:hypothetical protein
VTIHLGLDLQYTQNPKYFVNKPCNSKVMEESTGGGKDLFDTSIDIVW